MDNHYLLLLRKDDIIDLYKYGRWNAHCPSIKFDGLLEKLAVNNKLEKLFCQSNPFEYSFEYYLVHVISPKASYFEVDDILDIIALDKESYRIGLSLSPEITLKEPYFEKYYHNFQIANEVLDTKKGIDNIFSVFDMTPPRALIKKNDFEIIVRDSYMNSPIEGDNCIWYYLLRYDRHQPYPKDNRGFFLDALHALYNYEKKSDMDISIINTRTGNFIYKQESKRRYRELLSLLESQKDFLNHCEKQQKGYYKIAPLFLMLKAACSNGIHEDQIYCNLELSTFIKVMKDNYDNNILSKALYLLGFALGRQNTYQYVYKKNKLPILKYR